MSASRRSSRAITVDGHHLYFGVGRRLVVVDVSSPAIPREVGRARPGLGDKLTAVAVAGGVAYVTAYPGVLYAVDASDPSALRRLATFDTRGEAYDVAVAGGHVYVAGSAGLLVFRIGDWPEPTPTPAPPQWTTLYLPASTRNAGLGPSGMTASPPVHPRDAGYEQDRAAFTPDVTPTGR